MRGAARLVGIHPQTVLSWSRKKYGPSRALWSRLLQVFPEIVELAANLREVKVLAAELRVREIKGEEVRVLRAAAVSAAIDVIALQAAPNNATRCWSNFGESDEEQPVARAREIRAQLHLGIGPILRVEEVVEQLGVPVVEAAGLRGSGISRVDVTLLNQAGKKTVLPVLVVWGVHKPDARRVLLAVEFGYLLTPSPSRLQGRARLAAVQLFADELLAPAAGLGQWLPVGMQKRSRKSVEALAEAFLVPVSVVERQFDRAGYHFGGGSDGPPATTGFFGRVADAKGMRWNSSQ